MRKNRRESVVVAQTPVMKGGPWPLMGSPRSAQLPDCLGPSLSVPGPLAHRRAQASSSSSSTGAVRNPCRNAPLQRDKGDGSCRPGSNAGLRNSASGGADSCHYVQVRAELAGFRPQSRCLRRSERRRANRPRSSCPVKAARGSPSLQHGLGDAVEGVPRCCSSRNRRGQRASGRARPPCNMVLMPSVTPLLGSE